MAVRGKKTSLTLFIVFTKIIIFLILQFPCTIFFKHLLLWPHSAFSFCTSLGGVLAKRQREETSERLGAGGGERIRKGDGERPVVPPFFAAGLLPTDYPSGPRLSGKF